MSSEALARAFPRAVRRCWVRVGGSDWTCRCPPSVVWALRGRGWVPLDELPLLLPTPQARAVARRWARAVAEVLIGAPDDLVHADLDEPPYWCRRFGSAPCRFFTACLDEPPGTRLFYIARRVSSGAVRVDGAGTRIYVNPGRRRVTLAVPERWEPDADCWFVLSFDRSRRGIACASAEVAARPWLRRALEIAARLVADPDIQLLLL